MKQWYGHDVRGLGWKRQKSIQWYDLYNVQYMYGVHVSNDNGYTCSWRSKVYFSYEIILYTTQLAKDYISPEIWQLGNRAGVLYIGIGGAARKVEYGSRAQHNLKMGSGGNENCGITTLTRSISTLASKADMFNFPHCPHRIYKQTVPLTRHTRHGAGNNASGHSRGSWKLSKGSGTCKFTYAK